MVDIVNGSKQRGFELRLLLQVCVQVVLDVLVRRNTEFHFRVGC